MSIVLFEYSFCVRSGIDWQSIHQGTDLNYQSVTSGNGIYVAVPSGVGKRVATSP
jgi:hypothetical protein